MFGCHRPRQGLTRSEPTLHQFPLVQAHRVELTEKFRSPGQQAIVALLILSFRHTNHGRPDGSIVVEGFLVDVAEESAKRVEVLLRGGIELMVMTDSTTDGEAHERGSVSLSAFAGNVNLQFFGNGSTLIAAYAQTHVAAADEGIKVPGRHQVAGDLFHCELIEWLIAVERSNEIVAPRPNVATVIKVQSIRDRKSTRL